MVEDNTKFETIYRFFLKKIDDSDLPKLKDDVFEYLLEDIMLSALSDFKYCKKDITRVDFINKCLLVSLTFEEIEIISEYMVVEWLKPKLNNLELLKNMVNTKDFSFFSPANLLSTIRTTYYQAEQSARRRENSYSFDNVNLLELIKDE